MGAIDRRKKVPDDALRGRRLRSSAGTRRAMRRPRPASPRCGLIEGDHQADVRARGRDAPRDPLVLDSAVFQIATGLPGALHSAAVTGYDFLLPIVSGADVSSIVAKLPS